MQKYDLRFGFLLHVVVEIPACMMFCLFPSRQLGVHTPQAHSLIRQYAVLLLTSIIIAVKFAQRPVDDLSGHIAGALAIYHVGPFLRALSQIEKRRRSTQPRGVASSDSRSLWLLMEPILYAFAHAITGILLASAFWSVLID